jgi:hypothetical protein
MCLDMFWMKNTGGMSGVWSLGIWEGWERLCYMCTCIGYPKDLERPMSESCEWQHDSSINKPLIANLYIRKQS